MAREDSEVLFGERSKILTELKSGMLQSLVTVFIGDKENTFSQSDDQIVSTFDYGQEAESLDETDWLREIKIARTIKSNISR